MGKRLESAGRGQDDQTCSTLPSLGELSVSVLRGVGPARLALLERLGVKSVEDLLLLQPHRVDVFEACADCRQVIQATGKLVRVRGTLGPPGRSWRPGRRSLTRSKLSLKGGCVSILWFNQPWAYQQVRERSKQAEPVELLGRVVQVKSGIALTNPRLKSTNPAEPLEEERESIYPTTAGLGQELLRSLMSDALERFADRLEEPLCSELLECFDLVPLGTALFQMHAAVDSAKRFAAQRRLALEQALCLQAKLLANGSQQEVELKELALKLSTKARQNLWAGLPHAPTEAQGRVMGEIFGDLARPRPMRRLLQGDVGSGKTMVAAAAALVAAQAGRQTAMLAPTGLLAEQHGAKLKPLFERFGYRVSILTSSLSGAQRRAVESELRSGKTDLVVGTHALLSERVTFKHLALAVIDEQQRFGVAAKRDLLAKGAQVHALLVTATPIPRSLALVLFGELSVSVLDELPPGRRGVSTRVLDPQKRGQALAVVRQHLAAGERAFWVCPRIKEGAEERSKGETPNSNVDRIEEDVASAERAYRGLSKGSLGRHGVVLVHGALDPIEREKRLAAFREGRARLLVGTSVVEVGLDVPEATVIVIENAERMGLSQLHQLRGRIGRGDRPGYCLLLVAAGTRARVEFLEQCNDGFRIADEDLARRGAGELVGLVQAGGATNWNATWGGELELLTDARRILTGRPELQRIYQSRASDRTGVELV